jgi:hypothetical protein
MSNEEICQRGTLKILTALMEQAHNDIRSQSKVERETAMDFFKSRLFLSICKLFGLNAKAILTRVTNDYDTRHNKSENHQGKPPAKRYKLAKIQRKLRAYFWKKRRKK